MYFFIIFFSLIMSILVLIYGRFLNYKSVCLLTIGGLFICFLSSIYIFFEVIIQKSIVILSLIKWVDFYYLNIYFSFYFDTITSIMLLIICFISLLIHIYSVEYMFNDPSFNRFMAYLSLFSFFMLLLISADNYLLMFIGWEGVGLSSYLLINFWYTRILANKAGIKAMIINRIGDLSLLIGISILYYNFFSLKYIIIYNLLNYLLNIKILIFGYLINLINIICFFLFLGAMGKSAQLGLHIWLPDAMEGPTPVSALIHAATMVTAGVFLVIRNSFLFENSYNILIFISLVGGLTCLFSGLIGILQFDIKKIVAYSTCSQLGYMFFSCGMSNYYVSLFHLFNHAFFKALLFLSMGSIIHALCDEQDIRRMGGLIRYLPLTYIMVIIASLSLIAIPFLTGYYSKDFLLEFIFSLYIIDSYFIYILGLFSALLTVFYSFRLIYWVFISENNFYKNYLLYINELNYLMLLPMIILTICSIIIGYVFFDSFLGLGSSFWNNSIYVYILNNTSIDAEFSLYFIKFFSLIFIFFGIIFFLFSNNNIIFYYNFYLLMINKNYNKFYYFLNKAFYFDYIYNKIFINYLLNLSYLFIYKYIEKGFFELIISIYIYNILIYFHKNFLKLNSGLIYNYIFIMLWMIILFIILVEFLLWLNINFFIILIILLILFNLKYKNIANR